MPTINADKLSTPEAAAYYTKNANRIGALRTTLDLLGVAYPNWAQRGRPGRKAGGINPLGG